MAELWVAHIHAGCCDACLRAWEAAWPGAAARGVQFTQEPAEATVLAVTGVPNELGVEALAALLGTWAAEGPGTLLLVGDCAINGGLWATLGAPGVASGVDHAALPPTIRVHPVPGDPPAPAAILEAVLGAT